MLKLKADQIRRLREQKCWSQEELAHRADVSVRTLQRAEGGTSPRLDTVTLIAKALEVLPEDLLDNAAQLENQPAPATANQPHPKPSSIHVELRHVTTGKQLLDVFQGSLTLLSEVRGEVDQYEADAIGAILDGLRDYLDIAGDISATDRLRYGLDLTAQIKGLQERGWWILAGQKRHRVSSASWDKPAEWITGVVIAARADDSVIQHGEDGESIALVGLPHRLDFA